MTVLSIAGGWLPGLPDPARLEREPRARKTCMFGFALCVLPILAVTKVGDWPAVLLIGLAGSAHQAWSANLYTTVSDMFPKKDVATIIGPRRHDGLGRGRSSSPSSPAALLDHFKAAGDVTGGYAILFAICAFAYLVSFAIHHLLAPKLRADPGRAHRLSEAP